MVYGYVRVSSKDQHEDRQLIALREFASSEYRDIEMRLFIDKQSGKDYNRVEYLKMTKCIAAGDVVAVKSIDRLGRNYDEILEQWRRITKELGCDIVVLDMPLLDTRKSKDLTGTIIADIVLQLLSYVAETEREFIRQRQAEGIAAAKERGVRFGRPVKEKPYNYETIYSKWKAGYISAREASAELGVNRGTFMKWTRD